MTMEAYSPDTADRFADAVMAFLASATVRITLAVGLTLSAVIAVRLNPEREREPPAALRDRPVEVHAESPPDPSGY